MKLKKSPLLCLTALALSVDSASAATTLTAAEDLAVKRNSDGTASVEPLLNIKRFDSNTAVNRFAMIRFNSSTAFGSAATAATFQITSSSNTTTQWTISTVGSYQVYGVINGDAQDEAIDNTYDPDAAGTIYVAGNPPVQTSQLTNLGSFSTGANNTVSFSNAALLSFIQADTNGIVTLVITRNTNNTGNSVFLDGATLTIIPEPSASLLASLGLLALLRRRR
jgi:hypothetical protein